MARFDPAERRVTFKVVYCGPAASGKTTNLEMMAAKTKDEKRGRLVAIASETDSTLYFDHLPVDLGDVGGMRVSIDLYTAPGHVFYEAPRRLVLEGADGIIFVASSALAMKAENKRATEAVEKTLRELGHEIGDTCIVFQWNKRDVAEPIPVSEMNSELNRWNAPAVEAVAVRGEGVSETFSAMVTLLVRKLEGMQLGG